jgi:hypothetical protein
VKSKTENADLSGSEFINTNLSGAQFRDVRLADAHFVDVNLAGVRFEDVALTRAVIHNANCSHLTIADACYEGMRIDGILVTELLRVYRSQPPDSKLPQRLTRRCSEPGHRALVAIHPSRGPGR